jgi:transposase
MLTPSGFLGRVITLEDWAEIRRLHRGEGLGIKTIARELGVARNTVRAALAADEPPKYERANAGSAVDEFEPEIRRLLKKFPSMPASVIGERIGWTRSGSVLRARVATLRPLYRGVDPADRTDYAAGELAQCDLWFPPATIPLESQQCGTPPVLAMTSGF